MANELENKVSTIRAEVWPRGKIALEKAQIRASWLERRAKGRRVEAVIATERAKRWTEKLEKKRALTKRRRERLEKHEKKYGKVELASSTTEKESEFGLEE